MKLNQKIKVSRFLFFTIIIWSVSHITYAYGLKTSFGKVILEGIPIGTRYSMRDKARFPLIIKNSGDRVVCLQLQVIIPQKEEIQEGYEAIPSINWIKLEKDSFIVESLGEAETDIVISVPYNKKYIGKKFQVFIWSYTTGETLGVGLKSKLLFTISEKTMDSN